MYKFDDWQNHWKRQDLPWTGEHANDALLEFLPRVEAAIKEKSALLPLAGDSPAVRWVYERGFSVAAVEYVPEAAHALMKTFPEVKFQETELAHGKKFTAPKIEIFQQDIFEFTSSSFSFIYDRGAYVALPQETRDRYALVIKDNLAPGGFLLLRTAEIIGGEWKGPPHSIPDSEIERNFSELELVEKKSERIVPTQERYVTANVKEFHYSTFLFTRR